uniref:Protein-tyrosine-phosphatase n=1 Tax=Rhabditophanes sp. KR3021 TaxID=114890 RepID=A0AC35UE32_9BILA
MGPSSKGSQRRNVPFLITAFILILSPTILEAVNQGHEHRGVRAKRQAQGTESLLTVEWEGIQSGDHQDDSVKGFLVEFRAEKDTQWNVHSSLIPYKGANHSYRVQIPHLPAAGIVYFVRIKVLGKDNEILVETPEIRAKNEIVSIRCESDKITAPRNIRMADVTKYSVALSWDAPECGSVGEYQIEANSVGENEFDVHRQTVNHPSASIANLLPGNSYNIRVRAIDRSHQEGPWSDEAFAATTMGTSPRKLPGINVLYLTPTDLRINYQHFDDEKLQYYEIVLTELLDDDLKKIERLKIPPNTLTNLFTGLKPASSYAVGIIAYVNYEPAIIYTATVDTPIKDISVASKKKEDKPVVTKEGYNHLRVNWRKMDNIGEIAYFVIEYKLHNETKWRALDHPVLIKDHVKDYEMISETLAKAFSIRILSIDKHKQVLGKSGEIGLDHISDDNSCNGQNGIPLNIQYESDGSSSVTYTWKSPTCENVDNLLDGYEYLFWNTETEQIPEQGTFTRQATTALHNLNPKSIYGFRVRCRFTNSHSPWSDTIEISPSVTKQNDDGSDSTDSNLYNLRLSLDPPINYLIFTPLEEHRGTIAKVKLSYKGTEDDEWKRIVTSPTDLHCPPHVANAEKNYCYDLANLSLGVQYTSDVIFQLDDGTWTKHGSPLFFVLVEAPEETSLPPAKPNSLTISPSQGGSLEIRWLPPLSNIPVERYEITAVDLHTQNVIKEIVPGTAFVHSLELPLHGSGVYEVTVTAISHNNERGEAAKEQISVTNPSQQPKFVIRGTLDGVPFTETITADTREHRMPLNKASNWSLTIKITNSLGQGPESEPALFTSDSSPLEPKIELLTEPVITQKGADLLVQWTSKGSGRNIYAYRVQYQTGGSGWNPYGQLVPYVGEEQKYQQVLSGLLQGNQYTGNKINVHVQALDRNSYVLYTTPAVTAQTQCVAPSHPPQQVTLESVDPRHVKLQFSQPPISSIGCSLFEYELQVDEPANIAPIKISSKQQNYIFASEANQNWVVRIRTVNSAGQSPFSQGVATKTPAMGELIEGPSLSQGHGSPRITWRASAGSENVVKHFEVEFRDLNNPNGQWKVLDRPIIYAGTQRPYSADLNTLPSEHPHVVRVKAFDGQRTAVYTSGTISVQNQKTCSAPRRPPTNFLVSAVGPTQLLVKWTPIEASETNCPIWYVIKYSSTNPPGKYSSPNSQGFKNVTGGENQVIFDSAPFAKWSFEIQAANPGGASTWSIVENVQTLDTAPGPVSSLSINALSSNTIQVTWRPPANPNGVISSYEITYQLISRGMCDQTPERPITVKSTQPSYTISGLHPHSTYRVGIAAVTTSAGERVTDDVTTDQFTPTAPPAHITVTRTTESSTELSWHAPNCLQTNGDITEYEYEVAPADPRSTARRISDTTKGSRVQISGLQPATQYKLKLRAYTSKGPGPWSHETRFVTSGSSAVNQPEVIGVVHEGGTDAQVIWQNSEDNRHDKFRCRYNAQNSNKVEQKEFPARSPCEEALIRAQQLPAPPPRTNYGCGRINNVEADKSYSVSLQAHVQGGDWQPWTPPKQQVVQPPKLGPVPIASLYKISSTTTSLTFGWKVEVFDLTRCTSFRITVAPTDGRGHPQTYTVDKDTKQYTSTNLRPNTLYRVSVEAVTIGITSPGKSVDMSTDAEKMLELAYRPKVIEEKPSTITIQWDVDFSSKCANFVIEYKIENGAWQDYERVVPCNPGKRTYIATVENLQTNSAVDFRVKVVDQLGRTSNPSPEVRGRTKCMAPESPPQGIRVDAPTMNNVRVSWSRPPKSSWNCDQLNIEVGYVMQDQPERIIPVPGDKTDYNFPSEPNTKWSIRLRATNQMGQSPWSAPQSITTRQGAPGAVRDLISNEQSPNEIRVSWKSPLLTRGTIVGYDISYRLKHRLACPDEDPRDVSRDFVTIYNHKDLTYTLTGLLPYSLYEIKINARTTELGPSETTEVSTEMQPPSAPPLNLQYTYALPRSVSFQWEGVDCSQRHGNIINYEYEIIGQDDWAKLERQIANTSSTTVAISSVKAYNNMGGGPNTENLDVMTAAADAPLPPQDLVVTHEGTDYFSISWLPPYPPYGPHSHFKIRHTLLSTENWAEIELDINNPKLKCPAHTARFCYNVTNLVSGVQYKAQVAAKIEGGSYGGYSSIVIANTLQELPDAPRGIELIAKTDHSLHIKWIPPISRYTTQYKLNIVAMDEINAKPETYHVDHPTVDYIFEHLKPETYYNISISAGNKQKFGSTIWSTYETAPFKIPIILEAPIVTTDGPNSLNVQWKAVADQKNRVSGYIIEFRTSDNSVWSEYGDVIKHDSVKRIYNSKLQGLEADTLYLIRIRVVDKKQRTSEPSPEAEGRTSCDAPLAPPTNIQASSPSNTQIKINWQSPRKDSWNCGDVKFKVEYSMGGDKKQEIVLPSSALEKFFDSLPNTEWRIKLRTENDAGHSDWSNELKIKTSEGAPGPVSGLKARPLGPNSIKVTWTAPVNPNGVISGYTVTYQLKSLGECGEKNSKPITVNTNDPSTVLKDLLPDATYSIAVTPHTSLPGEESEAILVTTEEDVPAGSPKQLKVNSITSSRADVTWSDLDCEQRNGKITEYEYELVSVDKYGENKSDTVNIRRVFFEDLAPFNTYKIRILAHNSKGKGPFGEFLEFRTLSSPPSKPEDLREEKSNPNSVEISFLPPSLPNGIIEGYKVKYTPSNKFNFKEIKVTLDDLVCSDSSMKDRLCYRLSGLDPEEQFDISIAAFNGEYGEYSDTLEIKTELQNIPVLENLLEVDFAKSTSIGLKWTGFEGEESKHILGYVIEFKGENEDEWVEYGSVVKHRSHSNNYKLTVKDLTEATEYFFRLKIVGKGDKRGSPGPETHAKTMCGKPEEPPHNLVITSDFNQIKITFSKPEESTFKCDNVEFILEYVNTTNRGTINIPMDAETELVLESQPGAKWDIKMKTQTIEEGVKPLFSRWSDKSSVVTQSSPGEIFLNVEPKSPTTAEVQWDLTEKEKNWKYGVDLSYKLVKLGSCDVTLKMHNEKPIRLENVQEKRLTLENLKPGSEYEIIAEFLRIKPSHFSGSVKPQQTVRRFKTEASTPTGPPTSLKVLSRGEKELSFQWEPPACSDQNGEITQYEYEITGLDSWNDDEVKVGVHPRTKIVVGELQPGSLYKFRVRGYTSEGAGPWSEPIEARTTGQEIGAPRELSAILTKSTSIQLTWLPPYPERSTVTAYKIKYSPRTDDSNPIEVEVSGDQLSCDGYNSPLLTKDNICSTIIGLMPSSTFKFNVAAKGASGNWGPWSSDYFSTTRKDDDSVLGGSLKLISAGHDNLRVKWTPPAIISDNINKYELFISVASSLDTNPKKHSASGTQREFHFRNLNAVTSYNVTVHGLSEDKKLWFISGTFLTTDYGTGLLPWLGPPTDLNLIEKSDSMLHVQWEPPFVVDPALRDLITHYRVTISPLDPDTFAAGTPKNYTVSVPGTTIRFDNLNPETVYNITVQGGTNSGYGENLWGTYSTLATGQNHILKLKDRTPSTLTVEWDPVWGTSHKGYVIAAKSLTSVFPHVRLNIIKSFEVDASSTSYVIHGLDPSTTYNVSLILRDQNAGASGTWSTLPPGWYLPASNQCDKSNGAISLNILPIVVGTSNNIYYQVRYLRLNQPDFIWIEESERKSADMLCPKEECGKLCYLVFNLDHAPNEYVFQMRAKVNGEWNRWKTVGRQTRVEPVEGLLGCCIVPPPFFVDHIGQENTFMVVDVSPAATDKNVTRYYVVVDERDPPGDTNWTRLTDKVTSNKHKISYYVAASFDSNTLTESTKVKLGDGSVIGGKYRSRKSHEMYTNGQAVPLLSPSKESRNVHGMESGAYIKERGDFEDGYSRGFRDAKNLGNAANARKFLNEELGNQNDRFHEGYVKGLHDNGMKGFSQSMHNLAQKRPSDGTYSPGYMQGFKDGNSGHFGDNITDSLLRRLEESYPKDDEFRKGYLDGFKDAVSTRLGTRSFQDSRQLQKSLTELTERLVSLEKTKGDEIHSTRIYHVYNQGEGQYGVSSTGQQLAQELDEIQSQSRRSTLRRHYTPGDYLKYASDAEAGYSSLGQTRRSMSASALGRETSHQETSRSRHMSGASYMSRASGIDRQATDTFTKPYKYRSKSDIGSPRRYASTTLLNGARPGPSTPHNKADALHTLQKELDTLSRSPGGYASDTGFRNRPNTGYSNYDYESGFTTGRVISPTTTLPTSPDPTLEREKSEALKLAKDEGDKARLAEAAKRDAERAAEEESRKAKKSELGRLNAEANAKIEAEKALAADISRQNAEKRARDEADKSRQMDLARRDAERNAEAEKEKARKSEQGRINAEMEAAAEAEKARLAELGRLDAERAARDEAERARQSEAAQREAEKRAREEAEKARAAERARLEAERIAQQEYEKARESERAQRDAERDAQNEQEKSKDADRKRRQAEQIAQAEAEKAKKANEAKDAAEKIANIEAEKAMAALQDNDTLQRHSALEGERARNAERQARDQGDRAAAAERDRQNYLRAVQEERDRALKAEQNAANEKERSRRANLEKDELLKLAQDERDRALRAQREADAEREKGRLGDLEKQDLIEMAQKERERARKAEENAAGEKERLRQADLEREDLLKIAQDERNRALNAEKMADAERENARRSMLDKEALERAAQDEHERAYQLEKKMFEVEQAAREENARLKRLSKDEATKRHSQYEIEKDLLTAKVHETANALNELVKSVSQNCLVSSPNEKFARTHVSTSVAQSTSEKGMLF